MTERFFCVLVLILQIVLPPVVGTAFADIQAEGVELKSPLTETLDWHVPLSQDVPLQATDSLPEILHTQKGGQFQKFADVFFVPENPNLAELVGDSEVSVLADAGWQFVKNLDENQATSEDLARPVAESNLSESIRAGRSFNRESLAALARTEQAKAKTGQALALLLPSATINVNSGYETSVPASVIDEDTGLLVSEDTHTRIDVSFSLRQSLFDLPGFLDWRRRKVLEQASGESYRVSDSDAYISTVNAYLSLVSSRLQADITRDFEVQLAELLSYIEKRTSAGAASISDMSRVRARIEETLSSRLEQESAHATAGIEFVRLTNLVPEKVLLPKPEDIGASLVAKSFDVSVSKAMVSNPEIAAIRAELQAAKIDQSIATGRYLPRVDAEFTDVYAKGAGGDKSSQRDQRYMMVLNWNLLRGGLDRQVSFERSARYKELQYRLDDQRRRVVQALSANYMSLSTTRGRIAAGYQELKSIATAAEAMSKRMLSGNQSLLDLLDVYDRFFRVRSRLVSLHVQEMNAVAQLVRLTQGTPWSSSEGPPSASTKNQVYSSIN